MIFFKNFKVGSNTYDLWKVYSINTIIMLYSKDKDHGVYESYSGSVEEIIQIYNWLQIYIFPVFFS